MKAKTEPYVFSYQLLDKSTECKGAIHNFTVIVNTATGVETLSSEDNKPVNVYTVDGALIKSNLKKSDALNGLGNGTYIVGDKKVVVNQK